jgi:hypothetical protein
LAACSSAAYSLVVHSSIPAARIPAARGSYLTLQKGTALLTDATMLVEP